MSSNIWYLLILTLVGQCQGFCGEDDDPSEVPRVTVANSTHLRVSWQGLFTGCNSYDVGNMVAVVEHLVQNTDSFILPVIVNFEEKEGLLPVSPCLQYSIYLGLIDNGGVGQRDSKIVKYNDITKLHTASLYGGLLEDEKFIDNVCLKEEGKYITFPDPPEAVSDCILTRGDQENNEFTAPGQSHHIPLKILNPSNRESLTITAKVQRIEQCSLEITTTTTTTTPTGTGSTTIDPNLSTTTIVICVSGNSDCVIISIWLMMNFILICSSKFVFVGLKTASHFIADQPK